MNRTIFITIIIVVVVVLSGVGCFFIARSVTGFNYTYEDSDMYSTGAASVSEPVSDILIDWVDGSVNISSYDGDVLLFEETSLSDFEELCYRVYDNKLIIRFCREHVSIRNLTGKDLTVKIPKLWSVKCITVDNVSALVDISSLLLKELTVNSVSGKIELNDIDLRSARLKNISGGITAMRLKADELRLNINVGLCSVEGEIYDVVSDSVSGDINIDTSVFVNALTAKTKSGDIKLSMPGGDGFRIKCNTISGAVCCDFENTVLGGQLVYGDGRCSYRFDTVSGNITVCEK